MYFGTLIEMVALQVSYMLTWKSSIVCCQICHIESKAIFVKMLFENRFCKAKFPVMKNFDTQET
jgi:hypothetical protein